MGSLPPENMHYIVEDFLSSFVRLSCKTSSIYHVVLPLIKKYTALCDALGPVIGISKAIFEWRLSLTTTCLLPLDSRGGGFNMLMETFSCGPDVKNNCSFFDSYPTPVMDVEVTFNNGHVYFSGRGGARVMVPHVVKHSSLTRSTSQREVVREVLESGFKMTDSSSCNM